MAPLFVAVLSFFVLKEKLSPLNLVVLIISLIGVSILVTGKEG
jgi:drug/metabolite transporter (DMT)-like permease